MESIKQALREPASPSPELYPNADIPGQAEYRAPLLVSLGSAAELMRRDGTGHLVDGTGGWWVWGS